MRIALIASFEVKPEETAAFESVVLELSSKVLANEPGVSMYQLIRSQTDALRYSLFEVYDDAEVLAAHGQTDHFKALAPRLGACLSAKPAIAKFDFVAG